MVLLFFVYSGAQQQLTRYFAAIGKSHVGFEILIVIYVFLALLKPWSVNVVKKLGLKMTLVISIIAYIGFIASLALGNLLLIYVAAGLLGSAAACLATARDSYLIVASVQDQYGTSAGFYTSRTFLASATGIIAMNWMVINWSYNQAYLVGVAIMTLGLVVLTSLKDFPVDTSKKSASFLAVIKDPKILRLSLIKFPQPFVFGLVIGTIPLEVTRLYGSNFLLSNLPLVFYLIPFLTSGYFGKKSDTLDRLRFLIYAFALLLLGVLLLLMTNWQAWFVILAVLLMATGSAILIPVAVGVIGDTAGKERANLYSAFFGMIEAGGILIALLLGRVVSGNMLHYLSIGVLVLILILIRPLVTNKS